MRDRNKKEFLNKMHSGWEEMALTEKNVHMIKNIARSKKTTNNHIVTEAIRLYRIIANPSMRGDIIITVNKGVIRSIREASPKEFG